MTCPDLPMSYDDHLPSQGCVRHRSLGVCVGGPNSVVKSVSMFL